MIHEHHEWLADLNKSIVDSYEREQVEIAGKPERIQELGHRVEDRWKGVLTDWLPPEYQVEKRKYILLETEDGLKMTKETDLVVFYPHYPKNLRAKTAVLASGVAAAFSVRRTVGRDDIKDAYENGLTLRRGMKIRDATLQAHLIPPVFFGLLGDSHDWKAPTSTPKDNIKDTTQEFDRDLVKTPREGLDLLCIADLGTWSRTTAVLPEGFMRRQAWPEEFRVAFTGSTEIESLVLSGMRHDYEQTNLSPLTNFIGSLWGMLAINDPTLKPLADGLRITKTVDTTGALNMGSGPYKLVDVVTPKIASGYRNHEPWSY
jgi:hypothetical protein